MASNIKLLATVLDVTCFVLVLAAYIVLQVLIYGTTDAGVYPYKRGFRCDDPSIQRPIREHVFRYGDNEMFSFLVPVAVILIVEVINNKLKFNENQETKEEEEEQTHGCFSVKPWITSMISLVLIFCFGGFLVKDIAELSKLAVGRLRPTFMAHCKPNLTLVDCKQGYITTDVCTGDPHNVRMARMSFPAGMSVISMYGMLFTAFYLQAAMRTDTRLLKPLLQAIAVSLSLLSGLCRVVDNSRFLSDVLAGMALGGIMAWFIAFKILKLFDNGLRKPRVYTLLPQQNRTSYEEDAVE